MTANVAVRAARASLATAIVLLALKGWAAWTTASIAMLGSLVDTGLDLLASAVTLWSVGIAATPPDREHRFGHGKAEALAALFQVALITLSAAGIGWRAGQAMLAGHGVAEAGPGVIASVVASVVTVALVAYQRRAIAASGSLAIRADSIHYQSDLAINLAVIAALALDRWAGLRGADALFGIAIALWLAFNAWRASVAAIDQLMDREWPDARRRRFLEIAGRHPELKGIHDLRTRSAGTRDFVQFHVWVAPDMTIERAHEVMDEVEARLARDFPDVEIIIHPDPEPRAPAGMPHPHRRDEARRRPDRPSRGMAAGRFPGPERSAMRAAMREYLFRAAPAALLALAGCVAPKAPAPPAPPPPPATATPVLDWTDAALTPGSWAWVEGSARFAAAADAAPLLTIACEAGGKTIRFTARGTPGGDSATLTLIASDGSVSYPASLGADGTIVARANANDPGLDKLAFSRGRFAIASEDAGLARTVLPARPEPARVIDDCRR